MFHGPLTLHLVKGSGIHPRNTVIVMISDVRERWAYLASPVATVMSVAFKIVKFDVSL